MGRTLPTFNTFLQAEEPTWAPFRRALRSKEEKEAFDRLFTHARTYAAEATAAARPIPFDAILMGMLMGQEVEMRALRERIERLERRGE